MKRKHLGTNSEALRAADIAIPFHSPVILDRIWIVAVGITCIVC
eukprot:COSAG02_NODE_29680_length_565_cov_0.740343_1_plen_43_part_10